MVKVSSIVSVIFASIAFVQCAPLAGAGDLLGGTTTPGGAGDLLGGVNVEQTLDGALDTVEGVAEGGVDKVTGSGKTTTGYGADTIVDSTGGSTIKTVKVIVDGATGAPIAGTTTPNDEVLR
ncbi:unnamed protein product [Cunninghamella blakesleeana]